jgi:hypothetical protein
LAFVPRFAPSGNCLSARLVRHCSSPLPDLITLLPDSKQATEDQNRPAPGAAATASGLHDVRCCDGALSAPVDPALDRTIGRADAKAQTTSPAFQTSLRADWSSNWAIVENSSIAIRVVPGNTSRFAALMLATVENRCAILLSSLERILRGSAPQGC